MKIYNATYKVIEGVTRIEGFKTMEPIMGAMIFGDNTDVIKEYEIAHAEWLKTKKTWKVKDDDSFFEIVECIKKSWMRTPPIMDFVEYYSQGTHLPKDITDRLEITENNPCEKDECWVNNKCMFTDDCPNEEFVIIKPIEKYEHEQTNDKQGMYICKKCKISEQDEKDREINSENWKEDEMWRIQNVIEAYCRKFNFKSCQIEWKYIGTGKSQEAKFNFSKNNTNPKK